MRTPPPSRAGLRALLTVLLVGVCLASSTPARADGPVGGPRLQGLAVVSDSPGAPPLPDTTAASYVVADVDSGAVLAAKDPHGRYAPASTLKTLTAVTLLPRLDLAQQVAPVNEDVGVDGTKVGLVPSMTYSVKDLFTAMLVTSANDAAGTLATAVGGQPAATALMNAEAARLHAFDTHAVNTSGLDADGQTSSAYDLALIARAGLAIPEFRALVATRRAFIPAPNGATIEIDTHDRLLGSYAGALGIKNGFTEAARASFVGAATRNGHTLVVTLMRGDPAVWKDAATLLDWGFAATAAGARPVGRLVPADAPPLVTPAGRAPAARALPVGAEHAGTGNPGTGHAAVSGHDVSLTRYLVGLAVVLLLVLALLRRRAVVRARTRRRRRGAHVVDLRDRPTPGRTRAGAAGRQAAARR